MLKVRIIPCLDVCNNKVIKGVKFRNHEVVGDILELAKKYCDNQADELVFYDITASSENRVVDKKWIEKIANHINIPFCVAGGIKTIDDAKRVLGSGADKISINSPALADPNIIDELVKRFGQQCVVIGIDSFELNGEYFVYQYSGDESKMLNTKRTTINWALEVAKRGAGEIVLNCMNQDGVRLGYDIKQLSVIADLINIPLIASGGAGNIEHFYQLLQQTKITAALAASVFHKNLVNIKELKEYLRQNKIPVRI
jgi:cyclase